MGKSLREQVDTLVSTYVGGTETLIFDRVCGWAAVGWRRHHGAEKRHIADRRGWAGDANDDVEGNHAYGPVCSSAFGRGTGDIESCGAQKIPGWVQSRLCRSDYGASRKEMS